jgi:hypothetical protein
MVERDLTVNAYYVPQTRRLAAFARQHGLSLFASPVDVQRFVREGLPYDAASFMTRMVKPEDGTTVRGLVVLLASAVSDRGVRSLSFEITRAHATPVQVQGADTRLGWIAEWNSALVADGTYSISSVADDGAHGRRQSSPVTVTVTNR